MNKIEIDIVYLKNAPCASQAAGKDGSQLFVPKSSLFQADPVKFGKE